MPPRYHASEVIEVPVADPAPLPAIEVRDLAVSYGERLALDGISLAVPQGAIIGLLGPNGSGKSTLLSTLAGLRRPQSGQALVLGSPPVPAVRAQVGVVFQESCLDLLMTLHETLALHGRLFDMSGATLRRRIDELLASFGLAARARDAVGTLSGGLRRRLELARALLPSPRVLLLDEPSTGLDLDSRRGLWEQLRALRTENGSSALTIVLATNDVLEAERECDTVVFIHHGHTVAQGSPAELKAGLRHDAVRVECIDGKAAALGDAVAVWPSVGRVTAVASTLHVTVDDVATFVPKLFQLAGESIRAIRIDPSTLEDAYFVMAGASLRAEQNEGVLNAYEQPPRIERVPEEVA